ncbi:hypothetical protein L3Y34_019463 [Caenorhabditis briggsae]|uniref:Uncharacterized protein n=1 Tax=Caenorhabditis briggsae TaxID=6238 RepID=A0AAE9DP22_CAEBR|nr:hypothetical protein L3Y34_019463 [Caenorhabditis briggsae]
MSMFLSERMVCNYARLLTSPVEETKLFAMEHLLDAQVTLDLLEKYNIRMLIEQQYDIRHEIARKLLKKIGDLEEEWEHGTGYWTITPLAIRRRRSRPTGKFVDGVEIMEGPIRDLRKQLNLVSKQGN